MVDAVGTTVFGYDANGLLGSEDGPWGNDTVSYGYTTGRQRNSLTLQQPNASSWVQSYLYDNIRRLTNVVSPAGSFAYEYAGVGQSASPASLIKKLSLPGGSYITSAFDSVARLVSTLNQLTNATRSGTLTVAGTTTSAATNVTVKTSAQTNNVTPYLDNTFGASGFNLADGNNTFTAIAQDSNNRKDTNAVTINLS